jgi:hypothetical protein
VCKNLPMINLKRILKLAAILVVATLLVIIAVPVVAVAIGGGALEQMITPKFSNTTKKATLAEAARIFTVPVDSSVTPLAAGEAMHSLRSKDVEGGRFQYRSDVPLATAPWEFAPYDSTLFPTLRSISWEGPDSHAIITLAAGPTTPAQRAYLNRLAAAPVWQAFDRVGAAPAVDYVGGTFVIPFADDASWPEMPIPRFASTKSYAYASATRAAAHLANGRPESAEHALRSTISFGFAMSDNATTLIEQLIGVVIVNIGTSGLEQFFDATKDPRRALLAARIDSFTTLAETPGDDSGMRGLAIERAALTTIAPCTNVRELLFGLSAEHRAELAATRQRFQRFPSDSALFDMIETGPERWSLPSNGAGWMQRQFVDISRVAGRLLGNPRLGGCATAMVGIGWG